MTKPIVVIGSSNTDMVVMTRRLPLPGETVIGGKFFMNPGGKGANQSVAAARLGGRVTFVARIGSDLFGSQALQQFQQENIVTNFISLDPDHPSGIALIGVDAHGENSIIVAPGSNSHLRIQDVDKVFESLGEPAIVLIQMEIPLETIAFAITKAKGKGCDVILNPAPVQPIDVSLLKHVDVITPNESEAEMLTGTRIIDAKTAQQAALQLHRGGVKNIVISLGPKGAYLHTESISKLIPAPQVVAVDTTAGGDCFNGALAVALAEGMEIEKAVNFA